MVPNQWSCFRVLRGIEALPDSTQPRGSGRGAIACPAPSETATICVTTYGPSIPESKIPPSSARLQRSANVSANARFTPYQTAPKPPSAPTSIANVRTNRFPCRIRRSSAKTSDSSIELPYCPPAGRGLGGTIPRWRSHSAQRRGHSVGMGLSFCGRVP